MAHHCKWATLGTLLFALPALSSLAKTPAGGRPSSTPIQSGSAHVSDPFADLTPFDSGPGVLVATPTHSAIDPAVVAFATGCSRWLNFTLGSQPQLGKTVSWEQVGLTCRFLGKPAVDVTVSDGPALSNALGITHLVTSTVTGSPALCSLKLSVYNAASKNLIGTPIELAGTEDNVTRGLPGAARRILDSINMRSVPTPRIAENADDLREIGLLPFCIGAAPMPQRYAPVLQMSNRSGVAGLLTFTLEFYRIMPMNPASVRQTLSSAPNSPILLYTVSREGLITAGPIIDELRKSFPHNALLNAIPGNIDFHSSNWKAAEEDAKQVIRCSPHYSPAWYTLGLAYEDEADAIRHGLAFGEMNSTQTEQVAKIYPLGEAAQQRAVRLFPRNPDYQKSLSVAATFNSDATTASSALTTAIKLNPNVQDYYLWGLEIYQDKWFPDPQKLAEMANGLAHSHFSDLYYADQMAEQLKGYGFPKAATDLYVHIGEEGRQQLAKNPDDPDGHARLGDAEDSAGDRDLALKDYAKAASLTPSSYYYQYMYARMLQRYGRPAESIPILERILPLAPTVGNVYEALGVGYAKTNNMDAAVAALKNGIAKVPNYEPSYFTLAELYSQHNNHKVSLDTYLEAEKIFGPSNNVLQCICIQQDDVGNYDAAIKAGLQAVAHGGFALGYDAMIAPYYHKGDYAYAVTSAHYALQLSPQDEYAHLWAGKALIKMGRKAQAMEEWREGLAIKGPMAAEINEAMNDAK